MTVLTGENIDKFRLLTIKSALRLETKGMRHSQGLRASKIVRTILEEAGISAKRNKNELLIQFENYLAAK